MKSTKIWHNLLWKESQNYLNVFWWRGHSSVKRWARTTFPSYCFSPLLFSHCLSSTASQNSSNSRQCSVRREHYFLLKDFWKILSKISTPTTEPQLLKGGNSSSCISTSTQKELKDDEDNTCSAWPVSSQLWNLFSNTVFYIVFSHWSHPTPRAAKIYNTPILNMAIAKSGNFSVVKKTPNHTHPQVSRKSASMKISCNLNIILGESILS